MDLELVEKVLRNLAWLVGIVAGLVTTKKNLNDLKEQKKKKRRSPAKKKRRK
ncbi:hypothetical protein [Pseudobacillus badius]|uniref:hypothetical protein n=1 Tax=Bacillus badius TaxID=1455 RepID=UPI000AE0DE68|nr:hypothetical protein [Bacillus badius]